MDKFSLDNVTDSMNPSETRNIRKTTIDAIVSHIFTEKYEIAGYAEDDGKELKLITTNRGSDNHDPENRLSCNKPTGKEFVWHTHLKGYFLTPSGEDIAPMFFNDSKKELVFTPIGVWSMYVDDKIPTFNVKIKSLKREDKIKELQYRISKGEQDLIIPHNYFMFIHDIDTIVYPRYLKDHNNVVEFMKMVDFYAKHYLDIGVQFKFTSWDNVKTGNRFI